MDHVSRDVAGHYLNEGGEVEEMLSADSGLSFVQEYSSRQAVDEHGLVLLSQGRPYWVLVAGQGVYRLFVRSRRGERVRDELIAYDEESAAWKRSMNADPFPTKNYRAGVNFALAYVLLLAAGTALQNRYPDEQETFINNNIALFQGGEIWRPLTALFMHADLHHLLNNVAFGVIFGLLCAKSMGALLGWALILTGGVIGNVLTGWTHYPELHRALGASTAVFAGVGALAGHGASYTLRDRRPITLFQRCLPLIGGVILLGWYGAGSSPQTDVLAHIWGFISGTALGWLAGSVQIQRALAG